MPGRGSTWKVQSFCGHDSCRVMCRKCLYRVAGVKSGNAPERVVFAVNPGFATMSRFDHSIELENSTLPALA